MKNLVCFLLLAVSAAGFRKPVENTIVHYGIGKPPVTVKDIESGSWQSIITGTDIKITWPANETADQYWMAELKLEPLKTKTFDGNFNEPIADNQSFQSKEIGSYRLYSTFNKTLIIQTIFLNKKVLK